MIGMSGDAEQIDGALHTHGHRAARELWKLCWSSGGGTHLEIIAALFDRMNTAGDTIDRWVSNRPPRDDIHDLGIPRPRDVNAGPKLTPYC